MLSLPLLKQAFWKHARRGFIIFEQDYPENEWPDIYWGPTGELLTNLIRLPSLMMAEWQGYMLSGNEIIFLLWERDYPVMKNHGADWYLAGPFNDWGKKLSPLWKFQKTLTSGEAVWRCAIPQNLIFSADHVVVPFKMFSEDGLWVPLKASAWNQSKDEWGNVNGWCDARATGSQGFLFTPPKDYISLSPSWVEHNGVSTVVSIDAVLLGLSSHQSLGASVKGHQTIFRLFAPRATSVVAAYSPQIGGEFSYLNLKHKEDGVWEGLIDENLSDYYYGYYLQGPKDPTLHFNENHLITDPYAKLICGERGLGVIEPKALKIPNESCYCPPPWYELIICEVHVRDLIAKASIDLTSQERQGFTGFAKWLNTEMPYLKSLGVNAVEFQPLQAFDGFLESYHWGYMPINYFSPAPAYALNPDSGSQIEEFKAVVKACHESGMAVILDVVYNHMGVGNPLYFIDKYYYFRMNEQGHMDNVSGCGNDLRIEAPMARRLMIDSLVHWVKTYDIDGFRFDLAELIGVEVLETVATALKKIKPGIILIAEPWSFKGHIAFDLKSTGWSYWNDGFREFIPKYLKGEGNVPGLTYFIQGSTSHLTRFPAQSVNYVESHDDYCWIDKITENPDHQGINPTVNDIRRTHLMVAIMMASLGMPLFSAGQDFMRSKFGLHNTYQRGDINALDYDRIENYAGTARYMRDWIRLRRSPVGRRYFCHAQTPKTGYFYTFEAPNSSAMGLLYNANGACGRGQLLFAINPHLEGVELFLPGLDPFRYQLIADHERVELSGLKPSFFRWQNSRLYLPPLTCAVFVVF